MGINQASVNSGNLLPGMENGEIRYRFFSFYVIKYLHIQPRRFKVVFDEHKTSKNTFAAPPDPHFHEKRMKIVWKRQRLNRYEKINII